MNNKKSKIAIIVVSIIIIIAILAGIITYLVVATDMFKSDKELFSKYSMQNIDMFKQLMNSETVDTYEKLNNENSYKSLTSVTLEHSEGGEISNPINDLALEINTQKDEVNEYFYSDAQVLFQDEEYIEVELIRDGELGGIRFPDVVKEFVTIRDDEKLETVAEALGVNLEQLQNFIQIMQGTEEVITSKEVSQITENYINILVNGISDATFSNMKKSTITVNDETIQSNAYIANLNNEQARQIIINLLSNIKTDETILSKIRNFMTDEKVEKSVDSVIKSVSEDINIPEIKITVYEHKGITVQTVIEIGEYRISIENSQGENQLNVKLIILDEEANEQTIKITKNNTENNENYFVTIEDSSSEDSSINITCDMTKDAESIDTTFRAEYLKDITTMAVELNNSTTITEEITEKVVLDKGNNAILNDMNKELLVKIIESLKTRVTNKMTESIELLQQKIMTENEQIQEDGANSQIEINKFNAKFEFYTGSEVSAENVRALLDVSKSHLNAIEYILPDENEEGANTENSETEQPIKIKLDIEKNKENSEMVTPVLEDIVDGKEYKVTISYKEESGIIDYIMIEEIVEE